MRQQQDALRAHCATQIAGAAAEAARHLHALDARWRDKYDGAVSSARAATTRLASERDATRSDGARALARLRVTVTRTLGMNWLRVDRRK